MSTNDEDHINDYPVFWRGAIEDSLFVEIRPCDGYHGGTYAEFRIVDRHNNIKFVKNVYVNYMIWNSCGMDCYNPLVAQVEVALWQQAAKDILNGDETAVYRCCSLGQTPWNLDGTLKKD